MVAQYSESNCETGYALLAQEPQVDDASTVKDFTSRSHTPSIFTRCTLPVKLFLILYLLLVILWSLGFLLLIDKSSPGRHANHIPIIHTKNGSYMGSHLSSLEQDVFLGIPFAAPPLGPLRFRHPQPVKTSWSGFRNATAYSPQCPGYGEGAKKYSHSEDCLTINVIRPLNTDLAPLPVAVYIYGSGIEGRGGSNNQRYNMSFIVSAAAKAGLPFIGVSFNYRSSIWGFITGRQVQGTGNSNIALHDQRKALEWVQENISSFGGDPRKVTIWGGSSGARDVGYHLVANGGQNNGLFRAAIMQSGSPVAQTSSRYYPVQRLYDNLINSTGCAKAEDSLDCLRLLPAEELNDSFENSPYGLGPMVATFGLPTLDGNFLSSFGSLSLRDFRMAKVPVISGIVSDEGTVQIPSHVSDWAELREYLIEDLCYPKRVVDHLMRLYPQIMPGQDDKLEPPIRSIHSRAEFERITQLLGDLSNNAADRLLCNSYAAVATCYNFRFDANVSSEYDKRLGVRHGAEIGPLFQNFDGVGFDVSPFSGKDETFYEMSRLMGIMWAGFITSMDPNAGLKQGDRTWPKYSDASRLSIVFNGNGSWVERADRRAEAIEYINRIQHSVLER